MRVYHLGRDSNLGNLLHWRILHSPSSHLSRHWSSKDSSSKPKTTRTQTSLIVSHQSCDWDLLAPFSPSQKPCVPCKRSPPSRHLILPSEIFYICWCRDRAFARYPQVSTFAAQFPNLHPKVPRSPHRASSPCPQDRYVPPHDRLSQSENTLADSNLAAIALLAARAGR